jgi:hypothetical protein
MIFIAACVIIVCMVKMYKSTLHLETNLYRRDLSNTMRSQGLWYSGAFIFTWSPQFLVVLGIKWVALLFVTLPLNLMGFTNAVIYVRPRFLKFRRLYPNIGLALSIWHTLARTRPVRREDQEYTHRSTAHTTSENHQAAFPSTTSSLAVVGERRPSESFVLTSGQD